MSGHIPPSGQQIEIRHGDQVVAITEVGATLRHYGVGDRAVLDGFAVNEVCGGGRGQQLIPWPNRVRDGRYTHEGHEQQLALSEPANRNAIHGLVRWANWHVQQYDAAAAVLALTLHPQPGWAGTLELTLRFELDDGGLTVTTSADNVGDVRVPYGAGAHPYLTLGAARVDSTVLTIPAARYAAPDDRGIPVDPRPVEGTAYDFRAARLLGGLTLDTAYTGIDRGADGCWRVELEDDESGHAATVWADAAYTWLQVFTGDTLPHGRARGGLAVEPMTCGPDAFNTGDGLVQLAPGESHSARWGISPRPALRGDG